MKYYHEIPDSAKVVFWCTAAVLWMILMFSLAVLAIRWSLTVPL